MTVRALMSKDNEWMDGWIMYRSTMEYAWFPWVKRVHYDLIIVL